MAEHIVLRSSDKKPWDVWEVWSDDWRTF